MGRYAVIDVGTNSVKFAIGEKRADGTWMRVLDRVEVTRLGEGLPPGGGDFTAAAMERTVATISAMAAEAKRRGVSGLAVVGTMGLRTARNRAAFVAELERRSGVRIEVLRGEEEARLGYLAVKSGLGLANGSMVVFDTGGGSSQFTVGHGALITAQFSVNVGAVRFMENYGLAGVVARNPLRRALEAMAADLGRLEGVASPEVLIGMGGAVTNLTAVMLGMAHYEPERVQGATLTRTEVERQIGLYRSLSTEARAKIVGLQLQRADVILAGACIVRTVMDKLRKDVLSVSDHGLRHGLLVDRFGGC